MSLPKLNIFHTSTVMTCIRLLYSFIFGPCINLFDIMIKKIAIQYGNKKLIKINKIKTL